MFRYETCLTQGWQQQQHLPTYWVPQGRVWMCPMPRAFPTTIGAGHSVKLLVFVRTKRVCLVQGNWHVVCEVAEQCMFFNGDHLQTLHAMQYRCCSAAEKLLAIKQDVTEDKR